MRQARANEHVDSSRSSSDELDALRLVESWMVLNTPGQSNLTQRFAPTACGAVQGSVSAPERALVAGWQFRDGISLSRGLGDLT
jgi:hypothetical protein